MRLYNFFWGGAGGHFPGRKCLPSVLESNNAPLGHQRSPEQTEKDSKGADAAAEPNPHLKEAADGA